MEDKNMVMNKKNSRNFVSLIIYIFLICGLILGMLPGLTIARDGIRNSPPVASALPEYQEGITGQYVKFDGSGSYDPDGTEITHEWVFGDGTSGFGEKVNHSYDLGGLYNVTLIVTDSHGEIGIDTCSVFIHDVGVPPPRENEPPISLPLPTYQEVYVNDTVMFDGAMSYDIDGYIVSYDWDFGDNSTGSGMWVDHIYTSPGEFTVTLTVTDDDGAENSNICIVLVKDRNTPPPCENEPPVAIAEPKYQEVILGEDAFFYGDRSYDPDGYIVTYEWDFGDGMTESGSIVWHKYNTTGEFNVTLIVTDDDGAISSDTGIVWVVDCNPPPPPVNFPPIAVPEPRYQEVAVGENASLNGSWSYDPDGYIVTYKWDFGDNTTGSGVFVTHAYSIPGQYIGTLTVTDDDNASSFDYFVIQVLENKPPCENEPPVAFAEPKFQEILMGEKAIFDGSRSYDPDGHIVSFVWDFGDGTFGSGPTEEHEYFIPGMYIVVLTVTDNKNATASDFCTVVVIDNLPPPPRENFPPVAFALPKCQEIYVNETAVFDGTLSYDPDGYIVSYKWDFGDGTQGEGSLVSHKYTNPGCYTVTLTVTDDQNETAIDFVFVTVIECKRPWPGENIPPVAQAHPEFQEIHPGEYAKIDGSLSFDPDGSIVSYMWIFDDGTTYLGALVSHKLCELGNYSATLTVTDNNGTSSSITVFINVVERESEPPETPDKRIPDDQLPPPNEDRLDEPVLILSAGLINIATFKEGWERLISVEVTAYYGHVYSVQIELIDDGGLEIEVIPIVRNVLENRVVTFYLKIKVPELPEDVPSTGITIKLKAVGEQAESNIEYIDVLITEVPEEKNSDLTQTATTVGTFSAASILSLLLKRRVL
jgi:PKD repeat protein